MCLCHQQNNRVNKVCTTHRVSKKAFRLVSPQQVEDKCHVCQKDLIDIGSKIEVPKKTDSKAWNDIKQMIDNKIYFSVCQCGCR